MSKLHIIRTNHDLNKLKDIIEYSDIVSYDTETTGLDQTAYMIGFSICVSLEESFYVILHEWNKELQQMQSLETTQYVKEIIVSLLQKKLVMHNAVFDCIVTERCYDIDLMPALHTDTLILGHLLNENRRNGLKELGASLFGNSIKDEQRIMKESVLLNGGKLTKKEYELYKGDADLIAKYGAQDTLLTLKLFYEFIPQLEEEGLYDFFYKEESMPLLKSATYDLNKTGLKVDSVRLMDLRKQLEADCMKSKAFMLNEIQDLVKDKYPGTKKTNHFNINSPIQLSWLLFKVLGNYFDVLTEGGKEFCKNVGLKIPYTNAAKREFIDYCFNNLGNIYSIGKINKKTNKIGRPLKVKEFWTYVSSDKNVLAKFADKYKWVAELLKYSKNMTILNTYVISIEEKLHYGIIHPSFLQHGTTSGRYSSNGPNFQNLPRDDKRVKFCIVSRPGKVFVGADYAQLEPRVFASMSNDDALINCFAKGEDFYSVIGTKIFGKEEYSTLKDTPNSFAKNFPKLRDRAKVIGLATPYGRTANYTASQMNVKRDEAQEMMDSYFEQYPKVELMMLMSHTEAKDTGVVKSLFGRPRRIPEAQEIRNIYGDTEHSDLPYTIRNLLNLSMNHKIQSTAATLVNRASIAFCNKIKELDIKDCHILLQIHDEIVAECYEKDKDVVYQVLKFCMENTTQLPKVQLIAEPKIAYNLADLK